MRKKTGISFIFDSRHSPMELLRKTFKIVFVKGTKKGLKKFNSILSFGQAVVTFCMPAVTSSVSKPYQKKQREWSKIKWKLIILCAGLLRQQYLITMDTNRMLKSAYVALHVQRCPRLFHLLLVVMHWGRRRRLNGSSRGCFLSDESLATLFITFCEKSGFINEVQFAV